MRLDDCRTYRIWKNMKTRCYNQNAPSYKWYGAKGIKVCDKWVHNYDAFLSDIGEIASDMSLDRIDNNKDYSPENCRVIPLKDQSRNRCSINMITFEGKTQSLSDWAREKQINRATLASRINTMGWPIERALGAVNV